MDKKEELQEYADYLRLRELSDATVEAYVRQASLFVEYLAGKEVTKEIVLGYKKKIAGWHLSGDNGQLIYHSGEQLSEVCRIFRLFITNQADSAALPVECPDYGGIS